MGIVINTSITERNEIELKKVYIHNLFELITIFKKIQQDVFLCDKYEFIVEITKKSSLRSREPQK